MSELSGSLSDFAIAAVLRLLAGGSKTGILAVKGNHLDGSVFFDAGELTFATTRKPSDIEPSLENDRRDETETSADELIADVVTRLSRQESGSFTFQADAHPVHQVDATFTVEAILKMVDARLEVWGDILQTVGSTDQPYSMATTVGVDEKIELSGADWNVLAALGSGRSITSVSQRLRMPELETAEVIVRLKREALILETEPAPMVDNTRLLNGGRLLEPDRDEITISLTDAALASEIEDDREAPASELAARWRNLRTAPRQEVPWSG